MLSYLRGNAGARVAAFLKRHLRLMEEEQFGEAITRERRRSARSGKAVLLVLLSGPFRKSSSLSQVTAAFATSTRDTDLVGWYDHQAIAGAIFADLAPDDPASIKRIVNRVQQNLQDQLGPRYQEQFRLQWYVYPHEQVGGGDGPNTAGIFYPEEGKGGWSKNKARDVLKRCIDIVGSATGIVLLSPVFLVLGAVVKATSKGPAFFRQVRIGRHGRPFTFLKFRSMHVNTDDRIHREYVTRFISEDDAPKQACPPSKVFKIADDPRVTLIGRFLRRTSLDELPQFFNVLKGDMSLVGPRPPLPYEYERYRAWHRRRVMEAMPGLTGLWQVAGRSRTTFADMVRLDLRYAANRTLWLDFKILLLTPLAVMGGHGAH